MARFRGQPRPEIKDVEVLDFLLNTIRCPHELLPCCHPGTYARTLYVVHYGGIHTVVPVHYTMATKACVGKQIWQPQTCHQYTWQYTIQLKLQSNHLDRSRFKRKSMMISHPPLTETENFKFPSTERTHPSAFQHLGTQKLAAEPRRITWQRSILPLLITTGLQNSDC